MTENGDRCEYRAGLFRCVWKVGHDVSHTLGVYPE